MSENFQDRVALFRKTLEQTTSVELRDLILLDLVEREIRSDEMAALSKKIDELENLVKKMKFMGLAR